MNLTLFDIDAALQSAQDRADAYAADHNGEMLPDHWAELDALELSRDAKIEACIRYHKNQAALAAMIDKEIEALQARSASHRNSAKRQKEYLAYFIKPGEKHEYGTGRISWRESSSVDVPDVGKLPPEFVRVIPATAEPDKKKIGDELKAGREVPGATLTRKNNIQIK